MKNKLQDPFLKNVDYKLLEMAEAYENRYFRDMTFRANALARKYTSYDSKNELGKSVTTSTDLSENLSILDCSIIRYRFKSDICGDCLPSKKLIRLNTNLNNEDVKTTLLHEMVHYYEFRLASFGYQHQYLIFLVDTLRKIVGVKMFNRILSSFGHSINVQIPGHSLLFWMKTIELDYRIKKPFGTVAGYGKKNLFF